ncbi:MAG: Crp/Fnr family transcriptional regulator [Rhodospirillales bacterium]
MNGLTQDDLALLRQNPVFAGLKDATFLQVAGSVTVQTFPKHNLIFQAGDRASHFFLITSGAVQLFRSDTDGVEKTVNLFRRPQSFGEAVMFLERTFPVSAQTLQESRLLRVDAAPLMSLLKAHPEIGLGLLAAMSAHLKLLVDEITLLRAPTARHRVAEFILRQVHKLEGTATFDLPYSKTAIARRLDISPEVLSRTFAGLRKDGVSVKGGTVTVADIGLLYRQVGLDNGS